MRSGRPGLRLKVLDTQRLYLDSSGSSPKWGYRLLVSPLLHRLTDTEALQGYSLHLAVELALLLAALSPPDKHKSKFPDIEIHSLGLKKDYL